MTKCMTSGLIWGGVGGGAVALLTWISLKDKTSWTTAKKVGLTAGLGASLALIGGFAAKYSCERKGLSPTYSGLPVVGKLPYGLKCPDVQGISKSMWKRGIKVELEHTSNPRIARCIAATHFQEDRLYYDKLARVEGR